MPAWGLSDSVKLAELCAAGESPSGYIQQCRRDTDFFQRGTLEKSFLLNSAKFVRHSSGISSSLGRFTQLTQSCSQARSCAQHCNMLHHRRPQATPTMLISSSSAMPRTASELILHESRRYVCRFCTSHLGRVEKELQYRLQTNQGKPRTASEPLQQSTQGNKPLKTSTFSSMSSTVL